MEEKRCKIEGCKRPYRAKGYCNVHYRKWRRGELDKRPYYKTCGEEGCRAPMFRRGMCEKHYEAWLASRRGEGASVNQGASQEGAPTS